ncbi:defensin-B-like [Pectinophora gossypiella]|uniref:defensin-B-like n=1 Tax=Pectinophora gossypiella TaxID=13191 RepID=UPI00214DF813|nr:defensin-B-like [Pectinophora gossypiella]
MAESIRILLMVTITYAILPTFALIPEQEIHLGDGTMLLPRVACDLLAVLTVGHSVCSARCNDSGFRGGACENSVCRCQRKF